MPTVPKSAKPKTSGYAIRQRCTQRGDMVGWLDDDFDEDEDTEDNNDDDKKKP